MKYVAIVLAIAACSSPGGSTTPIDAPSPLDAAVLGQPTLVTGAHDVLFVGNSYVYVNDVPGHYRTIAATQPAQPVRVVEVTTGGYTLAQHANDARTDGTPLARWLRTGTAEDTAFDAVVLQEQSQIGGFAEGTEDRLASLAGATQLAALARARGAAVVLYLTWGREHGDPTNPRFATFAAMQDRLDAGYLAMGAQLYAEGSTVRIAPVGAGFRAIFDDVTQRGGDPLAEGSDFDALYDPDGSHPSLRGAYLAACIIDATITGADPRGFPDEPDLGAPVSRALLDVCSRVVADDRWRPRWIRGRVDDAVLGLDGPAWGVLGLAVAASADGQRVLVGGMTRAAVFRRDVAGWIEEATLTSGDIDDGFGRAVALSSDGTRAVVGAPSRTVVDGPDSVGAVHAFVRTDTTWVREATLVPIDPVEYQQFGRSVAVSADASRALVGTRDHVVAFARQGASWSFDQRLAPSGAADPTGFGTAVALSGDGGRALIGSPADEVDGVARAGSAYLFVRGATAWSEEARLLGVGASMGDGIGWSVALDRDGDRALLGAFPSDGAAEPRLFARAGSSWTEEARLRTMTPRLGDGFGFAVALDADGASAVVGAPGGVSVGGYAPGRAHRFVRAATGWDEQALLFPSQPSTSDRLGAAVAVSATGAMAVVGAPMTRTAGGSDVGVARVYALP